MGPGGMTVIDHPGAALLFRSAAGLERAMADTDSLRLLPDALAPQFRRASARNETNREFHEARRASYANIGAA
jgi:hypothetical protein